ncbi:MAG: ribose-phosphate pyrophosphokinase [Proteobacteria bacterium]|nr:ribose-phosphate pyrophosphokinase [Pseudomonadota bacterium]
MRPLKIFSGSSHPELAKSVCGALDVPLSRSSSKMFSNENLLVHIEEDVRGCDTCVIQTASMPLHTNMMELFILCDTLRAYGARSICAVMPYFPYIRSDKQDKQGVAIIARLAANLVETSGATSALLMDLHSPQAQGFFRVPAHVLTARNVLVDYLKTLDLSDAVLVSPDAGEVKDLAPYTDMLSLPMAIIDKRRYDDTETPHMHNIVGDVRNKTAILIDDEIASGGTICSSAEYLMASGARRVWALCTHPVFSGNAVNRLKAAPIERLIVTDSIPLPPEKRMDKLTVLSIAPVLADAIRALLL